jgi:hypothetical protein
MIKNSKKIKVVLHFDDHKKIEAFVALLAQIDKRAAAAKREIKETKRTKFKKIKDGSQSSGPPFFYQFIYSLMELHNFIIHRRYYYETITNLFFYCKQHFCHATVATN